MSCPFCDPDNRKGRALEEAADHYVMLSNTRLVPGHLLVIPKRHVLKPSELNDAERKNIIDTLFRWQDKITTCFSAGCDIRQNFKPFLKESRTKVDHVHFHLLPREENDKYMIVNNAARSLFEELSEEERERITEIYLK